MPLTLSKLLTSAATAAGGMTALRFLARRQQWEVDNNRVAICVDFDDVQSAAIRAALPLGEMFARISQSGATHISLPERTLSRGLALGQLTPQAPSRLLAKEPAVGHWNYLAGEARMVTALAKELNQRLPQTEAAVLEEDVLAFAGDLPTIGEIGLGFNPTTVAEIRQNGLGVVPRPTSYAWPHPQLVSRTLKQAAQVGDIVAFDGEMILGHEMHLDATVTALEKHRLTFVYFAESRHQKGDWFVAKRRAPHVLLGHRFSQADMIPLDYHAACHNWVHYAQERGVRFCYVNFFRVLHATDPLEGLDYIHHLKHALERAGFLIAVDVPSQSPAPAPDAETLALTGLAAAGISTAAVSEWFDLPDRLAVLLTVVTATGALAFPRLESARNERALNRRVRSFPPSHDDREHGHDHDLSHDHAEIGTLYPPSYAPKLTALALATATPLLNLSLAQTHGFPGWLQGLVVRGLAAAALATVVSGPEYQLRVETYQGFNLDWLVPLAAQSLRAPNAPIRTGMMAALAAAWLIARRQGADLLAMVDPGHAEGHTHHISAAMALIGDVRMALAPKPARKWAGLGPLAFAAGRLLSAKSPQVSFLASMLGLAADAFGLVGYRRPERHLAITAGENLPSLLLGTAVGAMMLRLDRQKP